MEAVFLKILNMSMTASWVILTVILLRLLLKKAPKWIMGILWGFVAIRLIVPFSLESIFSLIPSAEPIPENIFTAENPVINSGIPSLNRRRQYKSNSGCYVYHFCHLDCRRRRNVVIYFDKLSSHKKQGSRSDTVKRKYMDMRSYFYAVYSRHFPPPYLPALINE